MSSIDHLDRVREAAAGAPRRPLAAITDAEAKELRPLLQAVHPLPERSAA